MLSLVPSCISNEAVKKQSGYGYHSASGGATSLLDHICAMPGTTKTSLAAITPKPYKLDSCANLFPTMVSSAMSWSFPFKLLISRLRGV